MLDNNVWTFLVKSDAVETLQLEAWSQGVDVVVPPAIVIEALQANPQSPEGRADKQHRIMAMTSAAWVRLMPEAFKEANEVRAEVERAHPEWMNSHPRLRAWNHHKTDWQSSWWDFVRRTPDEAARIHGMLSSATVAQARADSVRARSEAREEGRTFETVNFLRPAILLGREPGWDGDPFDSWRGEAMRRWWTALETKGPDNDWLAPWLDRSAIDRDGWTRFWTREVDPAGVQLSWLRWAFGHVQATRATNPGTPFDNQIATYLPESDVFVTADKGFAACIDTVRADSLARLARAVVVPADSRAVDGVIAQLFALAAA
ncbi:MAG TPA: hypothetical protein VIP82_15650 [Microbacterium sp.]|uniref:hypothetical protein n=1 Tax=Microbacterium sp. TaxID=51671 RepID=UPI002F937D22